MAEGFRAARPDQPGAHGAEVVLALSVFPGPADDVHVMFADLHRHDEHRHRRIQSNEPPGPD